MARFIALACPRTYPPDAQKEEKKEREMEAECDEETTRSFVRSVKGGFQLNVRADMVLVERLKADILDCKSACGQ